MAQKEMHPQGVPKSDALLACRYPPAQVQRMKVLIHGRNLEITPALREYTNTKLERATSHFGDAIREAGKQVLNLAGARRVLEATREEQLSEFLHHRPQNTCAGTLDG